MSKNSNDNKKSKDNGGARVSFKTMIIAMIVALLSFLGFGGFELGNGEGADVTTGDKSGLVSEVQEDNANVTKDGEEADAFSITIREDKIYTMNEDNEEVETTLEELVLILDTFEEGKSIMILDDGAINKNYEEVEAVIDTTKFKVFKVD